MVRISQTICQVLVMAMVPAVAHAQLWDDVTSSTIGDTAEWTNKVELADLNGDGRVDILFANGGNYSTKGDPQPNRIFLNQGAGQAFVEATTQILGSTPDLARVIKARDVNGDGNIDIIVGATYQTQSRLYFGDGSGGFTEVTATHLPAKLASVGDLEVGDVDGDGDLDIVLADWGPGDPFVSDEGRVLLWLNDGSGTFSDAGGRFPSTPVDWSWDLELLDTDNDYDLDIVISCKVCVGSHYYNNQGDGSFRDDRARMPQFTNNYEFEPIDINGDGFFDLVTVNDGDQVNGQFDRREHVFMADGQGGFSDGGTAVWPDAANIGADDNVVVVFDVDSDGDPDFLIGALGSAADRLLINDGGRLSLNEDVFAIDDTAGTLGVAVADLNGDGRLDLVQAQGELESDERVYYGSGIAPDTAAPIIQMVSAEGSGETILVRARVHDNKTPVVRHDFNEVVAEIVGAKGTEAVALSWYGGSLWRLEVDPADVTAVRICATDAAGNRSCSSEVEIQNDGSCARCDGGGGNPSGGGESSSCGCTTSTGGAGGIVLVLLGLFAFRRRRKRS